MPYPDLEVIVRDWARTDLNIPPPADTKQRIRVENRLPDNLQFVARLVVIADQPSAPGDVDLTLDVADLQVDCYAGSRERAKALAELVRAAFRLRLPHHTDPGTGAFITRVQTFARPTIAPFANSSRLELCAATYRLTVHAAP